VLALDFSASTDDNFFWLMLAPVQDDTVAIYDKWLVLSQDFLIVWREHSPRLFCDR
jgi:hypothetical protein